VAERLDTPPRPVVRRESLVLVRARARAPKVVLLVLVVFLALLGLRVVLAGPPKAPLAPHQVDPLVGAQVDATGFAQGFARAYLSFDSAAPQLHQQALEPYISGLDDADAGFAVPTHGKRSVAWTAAVKAVQATPDTTLVTVAAAYDGSPRLDYLAVPVTRLASGQLAVANLPGLVGPPPLASSYQAPLGDDVEDAQLADVVKRSLSNYLGGARQNLAADLDRGAQVSLPPRPLRLEDVSSLTWLRPGVVVATVTAQDRQRLSFSLRYELAVVKRDRWFVSALNPAVPTTKGVIR
jgi:hypothetical protein